MSALGEAGGQHEQPVPDQYLQRAALLADLGRYEDAAEELNDLVAAEPGHVPALTMLARVRLAAGRPAEAIVAADAAVAADPRDLRALVARGMALADLDRTSDAVGIAEDLLQLGPADGYAQTSAAGILAVVRNGQRALDAAWRGVQLDPEAAIAHLVLGLVAARIRLFDLAERAYGEALRLDPRLADAADDVGIVYLEQHRYAEALEQFVARLTPPDAARGRAEPPRGRADPPDAPPRVPAAVHRVLPVGAAYALIAPIIAACVGTNVPLWRATAALLAFFGFVGLGVFLAQSPGGIRQLLAADRRLATGTAAVVAAPCLMLLYALAGSPWPLAATIAAGAVVLFTGIGRR